MKQGTYYRGHQSQVANLVNPLTGPLQLGLSSGADSTLLGFKDAQDTTEWMRRERDSQPLRTTYLQEEKSWRSEGERNMEFQSRPQVSLELVPLTVVTELPPEPRGSLPLCRTVVIRKFLC